MNYIVNYFSSLQFRPLRSSNIHIFIHLSSDNSFQSSPGFIFSTFSFTLSSHFNLGSFPPSGVFQHHFLAVNAFLRHAYPAQKGSFLDNILYNTLAIYISLISLFFHILHSPVFMSLHRPYIFLSTFFTNTSSEFYACLP